MTRTRLLGTNSANTSTYPVTLASLRAEVARLTPRDRWLLGLLGTHQVLTTEHIVTAGFGSTKRALNRLGVLHRRGVLDRFRQYVRPGSQSWRWTLGPVGAAVLATADGKTPPRPAVVRDAADRLALSPRLGHLLGVNGFFAALLGHARHHDGTALAQWWSEAQATRECADVARPDGGGTWREHGRSVPFWVEYDTGTERPITRVSDKLTGYAHLAGTKVARPVLFWLPSAVREANLLAHLARTGVPAGVTVATASGDHAVGNGGPAGAVWSLVGRPGRLRLGELPTTGGTGERGPWSG